MPLTDKHSMTGLDIDRTLIIVDRVSEPDKLNGIRKAVLKACLDGKTY